MSSTPIQAQGEPPFRGTCPYGALITWPRKGIISWRRTLPWLVKWVLVIPRYLVPEILSGDWLLGWDSWRILVSDGLLGLFALIAAITVAVRGHYPSNLFDLLMGLNRWVFRVLAYALLMTDEYPPFRLDMGGKDPTSPAPSTPEPAHPSAGGRL